MYGFGKEVIEIWLHEGARNTEITRILSLLAGSEDHHQGQFDEMKGFRLGNPYFLLLFWVNYGLKSSKKQ